MPKITRTYPLPDGSRATATIEIGDHFSLTGTMHSTGGAVGDKLADVIPELAPFARLHLANAETGEPMHSINALYFYRGARRFAGIDDSGQQFVYDNQYGEAERNGETPEQWGRTLAAKCLRVDTLPVEWDTLSDAERETGGGGRLASPLAVAFSTFVTEQQPRWKAEADEARALFAELESSPQPVDEITAEIEERPFSDRQLLDLIEEYSDVSRVGEGSRFDSRDLDEVQSGARRRLSDDEDLGYSERADLCQLAALIDEMSEEVGSEWEHGVTFISEGEWETYAEELANDIGAINTDAAWPLTHIDWKAAADALAQDFQTIEIGAITYYYR